MTPLEIRPARNEDLPALVELHRQVHELHLRERPDQFKLPDAGSFDARLRERLASADSKILVALQATQIVGYAVVIHQRRAAHSLSPALEWLDIDQIGVDRAHRRKGVATGLLQAILEHASSRGLARIELNSWAFNQDAHRAFERLGFSPKHTRFELKR